MKNYCQNNIKQNEKFKISHRCVITAKTPLKLTKALAGVFFNASTKSMTVLGEHEFMNKLTIFLIRFSLHSH
jgi:hypothetical protein